MNDIQPPPDFEEKIRRAMHTPDANPEFTKQLRNELVRGPVRMKPRITFRPAWAVAFTLALVVLAVSAPGIAAAFGRIFGYVPGTGLVETTSGLRMLAEPASVTREGVTVTVTQVLVYEDRVELTYEVDGITESYNNDETMCGSYHPDNNFWSDADADLRLPDGTVVRRDYAGKYQSENRYAMKPIYAVSVPSDVSEMTMVLKCIPFTRLGTVPENWEVTFKLVTIPAGTVVGAPVIEVAPTAAQPAIQPAVEPSLVPSILPSPVVIMALKRIVPLDSGIIVYFSLDMENKAPSLISIMPVNVYVLDSLGQKTQLIGSFPWQPFEHRVGSEFEFFTQTKPANGPLTVVVENTIAYYAPLYTDPPQAKVEEMSFILDTGVDPQHGQTWEFEHKFQIAGYNFEVTSARAVVWNDVAVPEYIDGSQGFDYGYQFAISTDPTLKINVELDLISDKCGFTVGVPFHPEGSSLLNTQLCRDEYPKGQVNVVIREMAVMLEEELRTEWKP
jgi:hypothetical protein